MSALPRIAVVAGLTLAGCGGSGGGATVAVPIVARDVLADDTGYEVVQAHPEHAPTVMGLCPSLAANRDGEDRLALVLPPPAEARFTVGDEGPALFATAAGVSYEIHRQLDEATPELEVVFEVEVNGERVFRGSESVRRAPKPDGYEWQAMPADGEPLQLARGDVVTLRTRALVAGAEVVPKTRLDVGFRELRLLHTRPVEVPAATPERPASAAEPK